MSDTHDTDAVTQEERDRWVYAAAHGDGITLAAEYTAHRAAAAAHGARADAIGQAVYGAEVILGISVPGWRDDPTTRYGHPGDPDADRTTADGRKAHTDAKRSQAHATMAAAIRHGLRERGVARMSDDTLAAVAEIAVTAYGMQPNAGYFRRAKIDTDGLIVGTTTVKYVPDTRTGK